MTRERDDRPRIPTELGSPQLEREAREETARAFDGGARPPRAESAARPGGSLLPGGRPLSSRERAELEPLVGHDLASVRLHADGRAAQLAASVRARAFTVGEDVVFARGALRPDTSAGRRLLAHELVHVRQQRAAGRRMLQRDAEPGPPSPVEQRQQLPAVQAHVDRERREAEVERARQDVARASRELAVLHDEYGKAAPPDRAPVQLRIETAELELAAALELGVARQKAWLPELQADEGDRAQALEVETQIARDQADLDKLRRIFRPERVRLFGTKYTKEAVRGLDCMRAVYQGLAALVSPEESKAIQTDVAAKAAAEKKRTAKRPKPHDVNDMITLMETAQEHGAAGSPKTATFDGTGWQPPLSQIVLGLVARDVPGFWFFGVALADAFHSLLLAVDTYGETPRIYWCDQIVGKLRGTCGVFAPDAFDSGVAALIASWRSPSKERPPILTYRPRTTTIWPIIPPVGAGVVEPQEAEAP
jgi:hypothetical protein